MRQADMKCNVHTVAVLDVFQCGREATGLSPHHTPLLSFASVAAVISRRHEGPGEMGKAVVIPKDEQEKMKELFKINQFNLMASDMIALNRSLPDVRLDGCVSPVLCCDSRCWPITSKQPVPAQLFHCFQQCFCPYFVKTDSLILNF